MSPDLVILIFQGFCHQGDINRALHYMNALKQRGLPADELVFNSLLDGCVKANDLTTGLGLFEEMKVRIDLVELKIQLHWHSTT